MKGLGALVIIVIFLLLIVGGADELQLPSGLALEETPTPAPTSVPVLAMVGKAAIKASEVKVCNAGVLLAAALFVGTFSMYHWLNNE